MNMNDPLLEPSGALAERWGPGSAPAAKRDQRYYPVPDGNGLYLELNAGRPLLSDLSVRMAVAEALDRPALARSFGAALPTDQLLPPGSPGSQGAVLSALNGPDINAAKALMHGRSGTAVLVASAGNDRQVTAAEEVKADLAAIGIEVRVKTVDDSFGASQRPGAPYDLKVGGNFPGVVDSTAYVDGLFIGDPPALPVGWQPPAVRAAATQLRIATTETAVLALLQGPIMNEVPMTGIAYTVSGDYLAPRTGCRVFPPSGFGLDLAALCLAGQ
jgi:ABC-type transport system substrate-binding protein